MTPASSTEFGRAIKPLIDFARSFGIGGDVAGAVRFYREALQDIPAWALEQTIRSVCANWKWGNRMPLPADLREHTPGDWHRLRRVAVKLREHLATGHFLAGPHIRERRGGA